MKDINKIINGDCFTHLETLPDDSFDLCLTDIPYGVDNAPDFTYGRRKSPDKITHGRKSIEMINNDFIPIPEMVQLLSKKAFSCYIFCGWVQFSDICKEFKKCGMTTRIVVWEKTNPLPTHSSVMWLCGVELCVYARRKGSTFNSKYRNSILRYPVDSSNRIHPTQKSLKLFTDIVETSSPVGGTVLDPFAGSGTTAIAALNTGRNFLCIEKDKKHFQLAEKRIFKAMKGEK